MGHGYCYLWKPEIIWLHAISDGIVALSYYLIPLMLVYLVRKRRDLPFHWVFLMFGIFILSCGTTHIMEIWTLWHGTYRLAGVIKAITAGASIATAVALAPMVPKALLLPSPAQLRAANLELESEIAERRRVEEALQRERNFVAAILDTVATAIIVLDRDGNIVQCNRVCEQVSGCNAHAVAGKHLLNLFSNRNQGDRFQQMIGKLGNGWRPSSFENYWSDPTGEARLFSWSTTALTGGAGEVLHTIASGVDITESTRLQKTIFDVSAREQARIAQDLHDDLGQHLTGLALMSMVMEKKLSSRGDADAAHAAEVVKMANEAIRKTRGLCRDLLPVGVDGGGRASALRRLSDSVVDVTCVFRCDGPAPVDNEVATHLFRIAQEAVHNSVKHGRATRVEINLTAADHTAALAIKDNGTGLPEDLRPGGGLGLQIMNHRARMIGGTLRVARLPEGGTIVVATVLG